ncbi:mCG130373, partial [Mus musculus]
AVWEVHGAEMAAEQQEALREFVAVKLTAEVNNPGVMSSLHSDIDSGDGNIKYILSGEGAGTIFVIDDKSGNIHATKTLDREERAQYTLMAQAVDRGTNKPLEPPSEFIDKVQDINDNPPEFLHEIYHTSVPERFNVGSLWGLTLPWKAKLWLLIP